MEQHNNQFPPPPTPVVQNTGSTALVAECASLRKQVATLTAALDAAKAELKRWQTCENCGEPLTGEAPQPCARPPLAPALVGEAGLALEARRRHAGGAV